MRENHFTSDFQRVKMANSRDPRMAKVYDKKSIYYHCVSLKKLLSQEEQALMQPLENSLRQQDKLRPPYGECHHCHDTGHWIGDCAEAKKLREQQMSTDKKKPAYGQCFICGLADHWAPNCPKREEDFTSQQSSISTEKQQSSVSTAKPSRKRKAPEPDISDISPNAWILVRQLSVQRQGRSHIVSFVNQTLIHLDPVQRWWRRTGKNQFLVMNQTVTL